MWALRGKLLGYAHGVLAGSHQYSIIKYVIINVMIYDTVRGPYGRI